MSLPSSNSSTAFLVMSSSLAACASLAVSRSRPIRLVVPKEQVRPDLEDPPPAIEELLGSMLDQPRSQSLQHQNSDLRPNGGNYLTVNVPDVDDLRPIPIHGALTAISRQADTTR